MKDQPHSAGRPKIGRPWSFDRDEAVETAMRLFWQRGYEGVSISDLTKAIGVAPPSIYAAFGSKAGLYREAMDRYQDLFATIDVGPIVSAGSLSKAVRMLLEGAVRTVTGRKNERGCMISSGLIARHPDHHDVARDASARREAHRERLAAALAQYSTPEVTRSLSRYLAAVLQGISIQARDGVGSVQLQEIVEEVVMGLEARENAAPAKGH